MGRSFLIIVLALDLLVVGSSAYVLWDRVRKNVLSGPEPAVLVQQSPAPAAESPAEPPKETPPKTEPSSEERPPVKNSRISFSYRDPHAKRVSVSGTFNRWRPEFMKKDASNRWSATLTLPAGQYAYNFIVDGKMIRDPSCKNFKKVAGHKVPASVLRVK